jgi:hypothetical protein
VAKIQLNLKMPAPLVARLREEAAAEGITLTALAERRLAGGYPVASPQLPDPVADRLAALEERVLVLEARGVRRAAPAASKPVEQLLLATLVAEAPHDRGDGAAASPVGERLGTTELAKLLGIGRSALLNFASKRPDGSVFRGEWRLAGRVVLPMGGPRRIVWERVEPGA